MAENRKQSETEASNVDVNTSNAAKKVAVMWPSDKFKVEGLPVINREGVSVTASQFKQLEEAAEKSGVTLREVNG